MNTFVEIVFKDPITSATVNRVINTATINAIDVDANGRAVIVFGGGARFPTGAPQLNTYESYGAVRARLAEATPDNPTVPVSSGDMIDAEANQAADTA